MNLGRIDQVNLVNLFSASDATIFTSIEDNLPNFVLESLSCCSPVVAFNIGGISEIIDHKINGYIAKSMSSNDLANGIEWILKDDIRRFNLGKNAREKVIKKFNLAKQAKVYKKFLEKIVL